MASPTKTPKALSAMRLAELRELAEEMGLNPAPKTRKSDLMALIRAAREQEKTGQKSQPAEPDSAVDTPAEKPDTPAEKSDAPAEKPSAGGERAREKAEAASDGDDEDQSAGRSVRRRTRSRRVERPAGSAETHGQRARQRPAEDDDDSAANDEPKSVQELEKALDSLTERPERKREPREASDDSDSPRESGGRNRSEVDEEDDRRGRGRNRRPRPNNRREREDSAEDNSFDTSSLIPVSGLVDMRDNRVYLRTSGYLPGKSDVLIPQNIVRATGVRHGDAVNGYIRPQRDNQQHRNQRRRPGPQLPQMVHLEAINGQEVEAAKARPNFGKLTPLYPQEMLRLETNGKAITPRVIDLVSPIGKGQRGLIVAPPKAGKTIIIQQIATSIAANYPDVHLMVVLVDERPEEVTDMQRVVRGEVIASTFDRPASDHTIVAELAIERAKRLVELGRDVVVLLDSITRLSRAYNLAAPASGRILSGGVDASALYPPKKFFGAARNIENGGSLTIIASALVETGSKMDEVIFEEFKGTGNMELRLSRALADKRIFPAVDVNASGTRREELLMSSEELKIIWKLRRVMGALDFQRASDILLSRVKDTGSNAEFLMTIAKSAISVDDSNSGPSIQ